MAFKTASRHEVNRFQSRPSTALRRSTDPAELTGEYPEHQAVQMTTARHDVYTQTNKNIMRFYHALLKANGARKAACGPI